MASPPLPSIVSFTKTWHNRPYADISTDRPELSAAGKNVVILGGGTGIGKAAGIAFAQAGARSVSIVGRRAEPLQTASREIEQAGQSTQVVFATGDMTKLDSLRAALETVVAKVGGTIDIFLNQAGILPAQASVVGYAASEVQRTFDFNLMGTFNALQAFTPLASPKAKLLHTGTSVGHWAPVPEIPGVWAYAAFKAAAHKMLEYYATENPHVHVVHLHPGIVKTDVNPQTPEGADTPELPGQFIVWLASDEAAFLRDRFVWANWDVKELKARAEEIQSTRLLKLNLNGVDM